MIKSLVCVDYVHCIAYLNTKKCYSVSGPIMYLLLFCIHQNVRNTQYSSQSNYEEVILSSRKSNTYFSHALSLAAPQKS